MARYAKFFMKWKEGGYDNVIRSVCFVGTGAAVCSLLVAQKHLEKRLDQNGPITEDVEKKFGEQYSNFLQQVELSGKDKEKQVAFLKNNSALDPHF
ncbi:hypothetical protein MKW94_015751 [Papaver nudicaule]|uniref:Uncharacterized protein n=1 Tax=Papaver nudicaule TaxID=74823 RepID=A0AA42ASU8_PAPNU|nr:hypothetical protein [Papaver nudicaule]